MMSNASFNLGGSRPNPAGHNPNGILCPTRKNTCVFYPEFHFPWWKHVLIGQKTQLDCSPSWLVLDTPAPKHKLDCAGPGVIRPPWGHPNRLGREAPELGVHRLACCSLCGQHVLGMTSRLCPHSRPHSLDVSVFSSL